MNKVFININVFSCIVIKYKIEVIPLGTPPCSGRYQSYQSVSLAENSLSFHVVLLHICSSVLIIFSIVSALYIPYIIINSSLLSVSCYANN